MNTETPHALATDYLAQLDHESRRLPADQAGDLVADIREHLSSALTGGESEARVREVLDRLGSPRALVDEALENAPAPTPPTAPTPPPAPVAAPGVGPYVDRLTGLAETRSLVAGPPDMMSRLLELWPAAEQIRGRFADLWSGVGGLRADGGYSGPADPARPPAMGANPPGRPAPSGAPVPSGPRTGTPRADRRAR